MKFHNSWNYNLTLGDIVDDVLKKIELDPYGDYELSIGTDSQVKDEHTKFVIAIILHKKGKGAWAWRSTYIERRRIENLQEKIMKEVEFTQSVTLYFLNLDIYEQVLSIIIPYIDKGANFRFVSHIDIGVNGKTRDLIKTVDGMFKGLGVDVEIKPNSYAASCYADKYSK